MSIFITSSNLDYMKKKNAEMLDLLPKEREKEMNILEIRWASSIKDIFIS
jgi:hypothetical protein